MWWKFATLSKQVKKHPGLVPMLGFTGLGIINVTVYLVKTTLFNPELSWVKKEEPEPWYK